MAEWSKASVLKTEVPKGTVSSNLTSSSVQIWKVKPGWLGPRLLIESTRKRCWFDSSTFRQSIFEFHYSSTNMKSHLVSAALLVTLLISCDSKPPKLDAGESTLTVTSHLQDVTVYVAFGSDSAITGWPVCKAAGRLNCNFPLAGKTSIDLPLNGKYLNATLSFDDPPGCGATKAELNLNNPKWYDITDISLVDGFNKSVGIVVKDGTSTTLGPVQSQTGNEKAYGVYPYGCDICVERQNPPCGISKGKNGCKTGTQSKPDVPCQHQSTTMGGGSAVTVTVY